MLNLLQCYLYHDNTRSLTFLNSHGLPQIFIGEAFCAKWRWYKRMEGVREGDKDHLRQRISYVGLKKDNRGVMRIVIDIRLESCYISWEAEREEKAWDKEWVWTNQGKADPTHDSVGLIYSPLSFSCLEQQKPSPERCKVVQLHIACCS